ncbi:MAG TPA: hypothetical protein VLM75_00695 [Spirochaetota bacterium]|nr:hypothetical protein [Spirochaetota bacterium]
MKRTVNVQGPDVRTGDDHDHRPFPGIAACHYPLRLIDIFKQPGIMIPGGVPLFRCAISIPGEIEIPEGASPSRMPAGCLGLVNAFGFRGYGGPQPPGGSGMHRYELAA